MNLSRTKFVTVVAGMIICVVALVCALGVMGQQAAYAEDSPQVVPISGSGTSTLSDEPVTLTVTTIATQKDADDWKLKVIPTTQLASGTSAVINDPMKKIIASFEVYPYWISSGITDEPVWDRALMYEYLLGFSFDTGTHEYDGMDVYIYVDHHRSGETDTLKGIVDDGIVSVTSRLSTFTIVIDLNSGPNARGKVTKDTGDTSPKTETIEAVSTPAVQGALVAVAGIAGLSALLYSSRKRTSKL